MSPDDMTVPRPSADLQVGDYVFACCWGDGEPGDPWAVGWIEELRLGDHTAYVSLKGSPRGWRRAMKITEEQGHRICALYPDAEPKSHQERLAARAEAFGLATSPPEPAAQPAQEWISVEDRLPDTARRVLACNPLGYVGAATYSNGHWNGIGGANGWMELPKPLIRDQEKS